MMTVRVVVVRNTKNAMVKTVRHIIAVLFTLYFFPSFGQVTVHIDQGIEEKLTIKNAKIDTNSVSGFRIQLAFHTDRSKVIEVSNKFLDNFPETTNTYTIYQQPYWKLRVGNFYREIDALYMLKQIRALFPDAFIVPDFIKRPSILPTVIND